MSEKAIAHVRKKEDGSWAEPHWLDDHLKGTAELAGEFARSFDSSTWGRALGYCHDAGKEPEAWQKYLERKSGYDEEAHLESKNGKMDHSTPGAKLAEEIFGKGIGRILSYCIAGHHAGLPDWIESNGSLSNRLQKANSVVASGKYRASLVEYRPSPPPYRFDAKGIDLSLWIRMLYSCLVDADFLDTEAYMQGTKTELRGAYLPIVTLLERFNAYMDTKILESPKAVNTPVYRARQRVLEDCRKAAEAAPGFFSLTVPTGGGKTLSSMAFGLEHAVKHGKNRIIYVIPYTSIIEQNADVFRKAVGDDQVVEHHSNLDDDQSNPKARLAAENWDAPVIVTTTVQFFESLFAARSSRCRKLHNIANSVVVLDEAQMVPVEFLAPILSTMRLLVEHYGVTFVICTATQPALEARDGFAGLPKGSIREIVQDVPSLYAELRRVEVEAVNLKQPKTWEEIAEEAGMLDRVLCVVSDRKSCRDLHELMPKGTYHLSALMCAQHRSDLISEIKDRLQGDEPVRVVSTQLVEAGVDIDFPVVYRAMAGLDSIAQAAGRCNREGKLNAAGKLGKLVVFVPPKQAPVGMLRKAAETTVRLLEGGLDDPIDHSAFGPFFSEIYWKANSLDEKGIEKMLRPDGSECGIQFRTAAEAFKLIDDKQQRTILVPYGKGEELISLLKSKGPERWILRKLQRYSVNVYTNQFSALQNRESLEMISEEVFALKCAVEYDKIRGLKVEDTVIEPTTYMV